MALYTSTILRLHKFTLWWDPPQGAVGQYPPADFRSVNSIRGGIQSNQVASHKNQIGYLSMISFLGIFLLSYQCRRSVNKLCSCFFCGSGWLASRAEKGFLFLSVFNSRPFIFFPALSQHSSLNLPQEGTRDCLSLGPILNTIISRDFFKVREFRGLT